MPPAARIGDLHVCPLATPGVPPIPHVGGPIAMGCPTVIIGAMPAARVGDMAICVGPPDAIAMGSPTVMIGAMMAARLGDPTVHGGTVTMGCPTVQIGVVGMGCPVGPGQIAVAAPVSAAPLTQLGPLQSQPPLVVTQGGAAGTASGGQTASGSGAATDGQPSRLEQKREKTWIGTELRDFLGNPVPDREFTFRLDTGQVLSGKTDAQGRAYIAGVDPDAGVLIFPQIPEDDVELGQEGTAAGEGATAGQSEVEKTTAVAGEPSIVGDGAGASQAPPGVEDRADADDPVIEESEED